MVRNKTPDPFSDPFLTWHVWAGPSQPRRPENSKVGWAQRGGRWYNGGAPAGGVAGRSSNGKSYEPEPVKGSGMKNDHPEGVP